MSCRFWVRSCKLFLTHCRVLPVWVEESWEARKLCHARTLGHFTREITLNDNISVNFLPDRTFLRMTLKQLFDIFIKLPVSDCIRAICVLLRGPNHLLVPSGWGKARIPSKISKESFPCSHGIDQKRRQKISKSYITKTCPRLLLEILQVCISKYANLRKNPWKTRLQLLLVLTVLLLLTSTRVQRLKPRRFENVRYFLIWPDSAAKPVLRWWSFGVDPKWWLGQSDSLWSFCPLFFLVAARPCHNLGWLSPVTKGEAPGRASRDERESPWSSRVVARRKVVFVCIVHLTSFFEIRELEVCLPTLCKGTFCSWRPFHEVMPLHLPCWRGGEGTSWLDSGDPSRSPTVRPWHCHCSPPLSPVGPGRSRTSFKWSSWGLRAGLASTSTVTTGVFTFCVYFVVFSALPFFMSYSEKGSYTSKTFFRVVLHVSRLIGVHLRNAVLASFISAWKQRKNTFFWKIGGSTH